MKKQNKYRVGDVIKLRDDLAKIKLPGLTGSMGMYAGQDMVVSKIHLETTLATTYYLMKLHSRSREPFFFTEAMIEGLSDKHCDNLKATTCLYNLVREYYLEYDKSFSGFMSADEVSLDKCKLLVDDVLSINERDWFSDEGLTTGVKKLRNVVVTRGGIREFLDKYDIADVGMVHSMALAMGRETKLKDRPDDGYDIKRYSIENGRFTITASFVEGTECKQVKEFGDKLYAEIARLNHPKCIIPTENDCRIDLLVRNINDAIFKIWRKRYIE